MAVVVWNTYGTQWRGRVRGRGQFAVAEIRKSNENGFGSIVFRIRQNGSVRVTSNGGVSLTQRDIQDFPIVVNEALERLKSFASKEY